MDGISALTTAKIFHEMRNIFDQHAVDAFANV